VRRKTSKSPIIPLRHLANVGSRQTSFNQLLSSVLGWRVVHLPASQQSLSIAVFQKVPPLQVRSEIKMVRRIGSFTLGAFALLTLSASVLAQSNLTAKASSPQPVNA